jgi:molecular chaperone DnaK (HSP70)
LTDEEVERMVAEAETYRAQDDELATKVSWAMMDWW